MFLFRNRSSCHLFDGWKTERRNDDVISGDGKMNIQSKVINLRNTLKKQANSRNLTREEPETNVLTPQLNLFDLTMMGIGGTVGAGIFATAAGIIRESAGPSAVISWLFGGIGCLLNALAYIELVLAIPGSGSCYSFAHVLFGEFLACVAGGLLTLEYGVASAGIARSWSTKVYILIAEFYPNSVFLEWMYGEHYNVVAFLLVLSCTILLLFGLQVGKYFINIMTMTKIMLVLFMIVGGFYLMNPDHLDPFVPSSNSMIFKNVSASFTQYNATQYNATQHNVSNVSSSYLQEHHYGTMGIVLGTSQAFFGYIGFDEICCVAGEVKNRNSIFPLAIVFVVVGTCILSCLASLALSGMQNYQEIQSFEGAFEHAGYPWASYVVQIGEILTMPVAVLISSITQPRLIYAMAVDQVLPHFFAKLDRNGNTTNATFIPGCVFSVVALLLDFKSIWGIVNFGVLISFILTNCALLVKRTQENPPKKFPFLLIAYVVFSGIACFLGIALQWVEGAFGFALVACFLGLFLWYTCFFTRKSQKNGLFQVPWVPFIPVLAIALNWILIFHIQWYSILYGCLWITFSILLFWFSWGYKRYLLYKAQSVQQINQSEKDLSTI